MYMLNWKVVENSWYTISDDDFDFEGWKFRLDQTSDIYLLEQILWGMETLLLLLTSLPHCWVFEKCIKF